MHQNIVRVTVAYPQHVAHDGADCGAPVKVVLAEGSSRSVQKGLGDEHVLIR